MTRRRDMDWGGSKVEVMKKFMNKADTVVSESLEGFVKANHTIVTFGEGKKFIRRRTLETGKVAVISGGGAGHEPMHVGFVGKGMLDAACTGHVFTSPTPDQIHSAIQTVDTGAGCLLIVKNYDGDVMNFDMGAERAFGQHTIETVIVRDDVACGSATPQGRRGIAGTIILEKILGAAAEAGLSLRELKALGDSLADRVRSIGVALEGVTVPQTRKATFRLQADEIEFGIGIHGEPGASRRKFADADTIVYSLCEDILADGKIEADQHCVLLINGLGSTPLSELYLAANIAERYLSERGLKPARILAGTFATSLDMSGLSVTLAALTDTELSYWDAPVCTSALRW